MTPQCCGGFKIWRSLPKQEANHGRDLQHKQQLIDLDHTESAAALSTCLCTELWKHEGGTAHQKHQNTNIIFSYTVFMHQPVLPRGHKYFLRSKLSSDNKNNCIVWKLIEFLKEHKSGRYFIMVLICALTLECVLADGFWPMQKTPANLSENVTQHWLESVSLCMRKCQGTWGGPGARLPQHCLR